MLKNNRTCVNAMQGFFCVLSCLLSYYFVWWVLSSIFITFLGNKELVAFLFVTCGVSQFVYCSSCVIDRLQLNKANSSDTEAPFFLDLNLCISNGTVSTKIYDKRDDFGFDLVNFPFLDGDVPRRTSY